MGEIPPFSDRFGTAFATAVGRLQVSVLEACGGEEAWPAKVCAGIGAAVEFAAADPRAMRLLTTESLVQRPDGGSRYLRMVEHFADLLRGEAPPSDRRPSTTEVAVIGGIASVIADHLRAAELEAMRAVAPELMELALAPYMSRGEAKGWARRWERGGG
jgi:hypothetical protein